jgi:hypothetical protein
MAITIGQQNLSIPKDGLALHLDANNTSSYPGTGTVWYDLSGNGSNFNITANAFTTASSISYMDFNGTRGMAKCALGRDAPVNSFYRNNSDITIVTWTRIKNSSTDWRTLIRGYTIGSQHQVIVNTGGWDIGMYDSGTGGSTGFQASGFSQQSLPGYGTTAWNMLVWRFSNSSPYLQLSYNDSPATIRGSNTNTNSGFKGGIMSLGGYHADDISNTMVGSQFWGDIGMFAVYKRILSNVEITQCYNAGAPLYLAGTQQYESIIRFNDNSTQVTKFDAALDVNGVINVQTFTYTGSTQTWTKPAGCTKVLVKVVGGGGGAAGYCESGGGGGYAEKVIDVTGVSSVSVTIGAGGASVAYYAASNNGGTSSFGGYCSATGGFGSNRQFNHTGGLGGLGSGGDINLMGGGGTGHTNLAANGCGSMGGATYFGGGSTINRSTTSNKLGQGSPGAGGPGGRTDDGGGGVGIANGEHGIIIVTAYR